MPQRSNNSYEILSLPIDYDKNFTQLSNEEISSFFKWFLSIKDYRLDILCNLVFDNQKECLNEKWLPVLEFFLLNSVSVVVKSEQRFKKDVDTVPKALISYVKTDNYFLDNRTISICYDISIYLGELIISLDDKIKWKLESDPEFADYGQPVLSKKGMKFQVSPFRVVKNAAAKIYDSNYVEGELIGFFNVWKRLFNE